MRAAICLLLAGSLSMAQPAVPAVPDAYVPLHFAPQGSAPGMKVEDLGPAPRTYKITLRRGDEIMSALTRFARENHIRNGHFTGIGAIDSGLLGWYDPAEHADRKITIHSEAEIISLIGNIAEGNDGDPRIHAHISVAFSDGSMKGGHLFQARISLVGEIYVTAETAAPEKQGYNSTGF